LDLEKIGLPFFIYDYKFNFLANKAIKYRLNFDINLRRAYKRHNICIFLSLIIQKNICGLHKVAKNNIQKRKFKESNNIE